MYRYLYIIYITSKKNKNELYNIYYHQIYDDILLYLKFLVASSKLEFAAFVVCTSSSALLSWHVSESIWPAGISSFWLDVVSLLVLSTVWFLASLGLLQGVLCLLVIVSSLAISTVWFLTILGLLQGVFFPLVIGRFRFAGFPRILVVIFWHFSLLLKFVT